MSATQPASAGEVWTVGRVLTWTADRFAQAGLESARLQAEVLLAHALGWSRLQLYTDYATRLMDKELAVFRGFVRRRLTREPLQLITGSAPFYGRDFAVRPGVLIPRPETEALVVAVLQSVASGREITAIDLGTGSGIIAITLALERPGWRVMATDADAGALATGRENAARLGANVAFGQGDWWAAVPAGERFDVIVANPPYLCDAEREGLEPEVRDHENPRALFGGPDGLGAFRALVAGLPARAAPGAFCALEIAPNQGEAVSGLLAGAGCTTIAVLPDLAGRHRVVTARWQGDDRG